jgi:hypothetical protein
MTSDWAALPHSVTPAEMKRLTIRSAIRRRIPMSKAPRGTTKVDLPKAREEPAHEDLGGIEIAIDLDGRKQGLTGPALRKAVATTYHVRSVEELYAIRPVEQTVKFFDAEGRPVTATLRLRNEFTATPAGLTYSIPELLEAYAELLVAEEIAKLPDDVASQLDDHEQQLLSDLPRLLEAAAKGEEFDD